MKNIYAVTVVLLMAASLGKSQESKDLCTKIFDYCKSESHESSPVLSGPPARVGKAGPRGAPGSKGQKGDPGVVDYAEVDARISEQVIALETRLNSKVESCEGALETLKDRSFPRSCRDVHKLNAHVWNDTGGVFNIYPTQFLDRTQVYCDLKVDGGGWIVFQRRMDGSEDFYRGWDDYVNGFGEKDKEFWLGLETLHQITKGGGYELRVDMADWDGNTAYAKYGTFSIGNSDTFYQFSVGSYSGTAGDSLGNAHHVGRGFTTKDADHDKDDGNCAVQFKGAFWYGSCHGANLNGMYVVGGVTEEYATSVVWSSWKGHYYSLKSVEMKFRKKR